MRFVVYGAGAVGGVIGGRLFEHGHEVALIARGQHLGALATRGLRLESPSGSVTLPVHAAGSPADVGLRDGDVVVLATKSQDTAAAVCALAAAAPPHLPVVCAQNGVDNERTALRRFPRVYGMCVLLPASHLRPGVVRVHSAPVSGILDVGRWPAGTDDVADHVAAALRSSTFASRPRRDIARWKYGKLLVNLTNAVEAVCGPAAWAGGALVRLVQAEGVACLRAAGIPYVDRDEARARRGDLLTVTPIGEGERPGSSTWQSLARGTGSIETDFLSGEIVLLGRLHGVPTPANGLLQRLAGELAREGAVPGSIPEDEVLARLTEEQGRPGAGETARPAPQASGETGRKVARR